MGRSKQGDSSFGYERVAAEFMASRSEIGVATVRRWLETLPDGAAVLDLGCGHGTPVSREIVNAGLTVYGIDASPSLVAEYRARFPQAEVECSSVEGSDFFGRMFDGVIAWGLVFLLPVAAQSRLIRRVAGVLEPGGRLLFTAPERVCEWEDSLTGRISRSLGARTYERLLRDAGLELFAEMDDEGENHYYSAVKRGSGQSGRGR